MDINTQPAWSKRQLKRLGQALLDSAPAPAGCPSYGDVMVWHHELAAEVANTIRALDWGLDIPLDVTSRGKTHDTLVQKLRRSSSITLDQIQDLAGVRVDGPFTLRSQTDFARALAAVVGVDERGMRDMRDTPHSGYRAFHLWVRCPAGRVEIQIRTEGQSEWANTYERLGDLIGRGIRYGEPARDELSQQAVDNLHKLSRNLASIEEVVNLAETAQKFPPHQFRTLLEGRRDIPTEAEADLRRIIQYLEAADDSRDDILEVHREYMSHLRAIRRMIEDLEEV